jgi:hypothetical protein
MSSVLEFSSKAFTTPIFLTNICTTPSSELNDTSYSLPKLKIDLIVILPVIYSYSLEDFNASIASFNCEIKGLVSSSLCSLYHS